MCGYENPQDRQEILRLTKHLAANAVFYCFQGQITVFLISFFGHHVSSVAEVGALGRLAMIFAVGMLVLATSALLAPYLQALSGREVDNAGLLLAPRGAGTMAGVILAGRLSNRVDPRLLMFVGILW